jgi:hypothetical protein
MLTEFWLENHKEKRPLGIPRRRGEDNIEMDLREKWLEGVNWIDLAQDRDWRCLCEHGNEPSASIKDWEFLDWATISF